MAERVYVDRGVTIPLSTIVAGGQNGVLSHLRDGLREAEVALEKAGVEVSAARANLERAELRFARAEAQAVAWRLAHDSAKRLFEEAQR